MDCRSQKYFVPTNILPYLATRGCYWGRCEFCDHGEGYTAGYRSKKIQDVLADIKYLRDKYGVRHFHFTDESYPPALFRKLARGLVEEKMDIFWTTHMRFEKSLLDDGVWEDAKDSGCRYLHFGYESGVERVLKLMDKATTTEVMTKHLKLTADAGIWNHCMGFFGFPGETREEAWQSVEFLEQNKNYVHSLGFGTFDLGRHNPVAKHPEQMGRDGLQESGVGSGARLLLHREERDEHRRGGAGVPGIRTEPQPRLGSAPVHPGIYFPVHLPVRTSEAERFAI